MEKEIIIKALECCAYGGDATKTQVEVCLPCPYFNEGNCTDILKENALSLIKELTEENEKLKSQKYMAYSDGRLEMIPTVESVKADTVRKMQTEIKKTFSAICKGEMVDLYRIIDQIAKEMVEEGK